MGMNTRAREASLITLMRRQRSWTTAELATELRVSRRTVLRDVARLREAGFEIRSASGPAGGITLADSSLMLTSRLNTEQVVALILSVEICRATSSIPFLAGAEAALSKIEGALPPTRQAELQRFLRRILIGEPLTETSGLAPVDDHLVSSFESAFSQRRVFCFEYKDRHGVRSHREVEPYGMLVRAPVWYCIAWDRDRQAPRLFRADRMSHAVVTGDTFQPRPGKQLTRDCPDAIPHRANHKPPPVVA
jgi:predicted DNA-binding transcriptional regulator YafY